MKIKKLAIDGGPKTVRGLGAPPPKLGADELAALVQLWNLSPSARRRIERILKTDHGLRGPHLFRYYGSQPSRVAAAEKLLAGKIGVRHCLGLNSGTSALISALRALGVGAGDEVIIPAYTFFATAAAVVACNAIPVICEVDESLNLDPDAARKAITRRTKAIIPVHMRGVPARMDAIMEMAKRKGLPVIEDVAQACGGSFGGKRLGAIGEIGCFSFDYYKVVVSGEGGFLTTDDEYLFMRAQGWHDTAACWRPDRYGKERTKGELFCGENYRMSELVGAIAAPQIRKMDGLLKKLRRNKVRIKSAIAPAPGMTFRHVPDAEGDVGTVLMFFLPNAAVKRRVVAALAAEGVPAKSPYSSEERDWHVYCYWEHILKRKSVARDGLPWSAVPKSQLPKYSKDMCPRTLDLLARSVSVGIAPHYSAQTCREIAQAINKVLRAYLG
jgi:8-amino-3,8-dideoxy-alpha-D-manno-octulosonate transaminase